MRLDQVPPWLWGAGGVLVLALLSGSPKNPAAGRWRGGLPPLGPLVDFYADPEGRIHVRDETGVDTVPELPARERDLFRAMVERYEPLLGEMIERRGLEKATAYAILWAEGGGVSPRAVSPAGAVGIYQLMPVHWGTRTREAMFDPVTNADIATGLLVKLRNARTALTPGARWSVVEIASMYNAGAGPSGNRPWSNADWTARSRNPKDLTRWGIVSEPHYIDRAVAASNTYVALFGSPPLA